MLKTCLFFCLFCSATHAQSVDFQFYGKSIPEIRQYFQTSGPGFRAIAFQPEFTLPTAPAAVTEKDEIPLFFSPGLAQFQVEDLPFFCRIEHKMGKKLPLLFKFRLGSVEYVDWLEGKK
jgi:hypothetical protein